MAQRHANLLALTYPKQTNRNLHVQQQKSWLYRDNGVLGVLRNISGPEGDRIRKYIVQVFKEWNLRVTVDVNRKIVDLLNVTFDLKSGKYAL